MSFYDVISERLAALTGSATPVEARDALNEFNVRDIEAVRVSEGGGGGSLPDPVPAPLNVEVTADGTNGVSIDASDAGLQDGDPLLIAAGDPDRLSNSHAIHVTGKNGNDAVRIDAYGTLYLADSTGSAPNALQYTAFPAPMALAYGAKAAPDSPSNFLAGFHSGGALVTAAHAAPADGDLAAGQLAIWFDQTDGAAKLMIKAKTANGTVAVGEVALT